jgi:ligand-binding sensor domain-containing protein
MLRWRLALLVVATASPLVTSAWGASAKPSIYSNTEYIEDLAAGDGVLWVATHGGIEEYDLASLKRRRLYNTNDGLPTIEIRKLETEDGALVARTENARCLLAEGAFACGPAPTLPAPKPSYPEWMEGTRVTSNLVLGKRRFVGTAGRGLWLDGQRPRRLSPGHQLCGNHIEAIAEFNGQLWVGTFDEGLCRWDGKRFVSVRLPFRMVNDLAATDQGLFVATTQGLFRTRDGNRFDRIALFDTRGINDLAVDGDTLWATSTATLWRIPIGRKGRPRGFWQPGGTRSLQAVDAVDGNVWLATEDRGLLRMDGKRFVIFDRAAGLPTSWVVDVAAMADGSAYAATLRYGLVHVGRDGKITAIKGIPDKWLLHVSRNDQNLWVGTQAGAASFDDSGSHPLTALPNNCVHALKETDAGLWAATEGGLALYSK